MRNRVRQADIERLAKVVIQQLKVAGYIARDAAMDLQCGSPSAGRAWRLYYSSPNSGGQSTIPYAGLDDGWPNMGYLGWTKGEAHAKLVTVSDGLASEIHNRGIKWGEYA